MSSESSSNFPNPKNSETLEERDDWDHKSSPEEVESKARSSRKKFLVLGIVLLALLSLPSYRAIKSWRAHEFISRSWVPFAVGDFPQGFSLLKQALALSPGSRSVRHALEIYNARVGDTHSLDSLRREMQSNSLDITEILGMAEVDALWKRYTGVYEALGYLPKQLGNNERLRLTLIQASLLKNQGESSKAAEQCFTVATMMDKTDSGFLRIQGALSLVLMHEKGADEKAFATLLSVAGDSTQASPPAWRLAANLLLTPLAENNRIATHAHIDELLKLVPTSPSVTINDHLLAAQLEMLADPSQKDSVLQKLTALYQNADRSSMLTLARWMNAKGYHAETIRFAGEVKPRVDTEWLLIVMDAKGALGLWKELTSMLDSPAGEGIPDGVRYLFQARLATIKGDKSAADDAWIGVSTSLHIEKPETLAYIAGYEEQIGATAEATKTYREMANRDKTRRAALIALIRISPSTTPAANMIPLYEELVSSAPDLTDAAGDLNYLKLLVGEDILGVSQDAERLLSAQPNSLARISVAALARFKRGNLKEALAIYDGKSIDWGSAEYPWRLIRSVLLRAAGETSEADHLSATLDMSKLRPEEYALLKS